MGGRPTGHATVAAALSIEFRAQLLLIELPLPTFFCFRQTSVRLAELNNCRIRNHTLSSKVFEKEVDDDNPQTSDRRVFVVKCHDCNHEWKETWTRSRWLLRNGYDTMTMAIHNPPPRR